MATEDAVSLLRTLKAAGEKTGAVEAEGALHLRRNSRRTMDGIHDAATILQGTPSLILPSPRFPGASPTPPTHTTATTTTTTITTASSGGASSSATLLSPLNFNSGSIAIPGATSPSSSSSAFAGSYAAPQSGNGGGGGGITLPTVGSANASLPVIASVASSPGASPSRLAVRPSNALMPLPSPTGSSPNGGGGMMVAGCSGGPPSPPGPGPLNLNPGLQRRSVHLHSSTGSPYDALQLPHSHGSPLPFLFDPPVSVPVAAAAAGAASSLSGGGGGPIPIPGVSAPGSPGGRQVQLSAVVQLSPPGGSSLPLLTSVSSGGGANGSGGGGGLPPPAPMPSLLTSANVRSASSRSGLCGALGPLVSSGAGGSGGCGGSGSPFSKSHPAAGSPPTGGGVITPLGAIAAAAAAGGAVTSVASGRYLRPPPIPCSPFGAPLTAVPAAAPPSSGSLSPSVTSPIPGILASPNPRNGNIPVQAESGQASSLPLTMMPGAGQAALQLQLAATAVEATAVPPSSSTLQPQYSSTRPSSARSVAGGVTAPEVLNGTLSSRRLSMTGVFEAALAAAPSQKLVLAAAHELQHAQMLHLNNPINNTQNNNNNYYNNQNQQQLPAQLQQLLPPSQLPLQQQGRPVLTSARGLSATGSGATGDTGNGGGGAAAAATSLIHPPSRETRSSDPGMSIPMLAASTASSEFGFPTPESSSAGRPSLAPLPSTAMQAVRTGTATAMAPASGSGWPHPTPHTVSSPQLQLRASQRPEPLPQRPEPLPPPVTLPTPATTTALPEPVLQRLESLPPLSVPSSMPTLAAAAAASSPAKTPPVPLGRAGTLVPLAASEELPFTLAAGPLAESTLDPDTPDLDPAALLGPAFKEGSGSGYRSGSKVESMELTVRSIATRPASPRAVATSAGDKFAVQSSVRQRLQTDPLQFHPPTSATTGAVRRHSGSSFHLDPLEATPRLILGSGAAAAATGPPLRTGRSASPGPKLAAATSGGTSLWVPSQDILPHLISRGSGGSSSGASSGGGGVSSRPLNFSPTAPAGLAFPPGSWSLLGVELPTPRLRSKSGTGAQPVVGDSGFAVRAPASQEQQQQQQQETVQQQRGVKGLQSNYLQALATAAGLNAGSSGPLLRRQRSMSDSGCGCGFLAAATDSGPVGLPLEGGLAVLGDMWGRVQAERNHNTRYNLMGVAAAACAAGAVGDLSDTLDDTMVPQQQQGLLPHHQRTQNPAESSFIEVVTERETVPRNHNPSVSVREASTSDGGRCLTSSSSRNPQSCGGGGDYNGDGDGDGSGRCVRLDASVSSLPLKALKAAAAAAGGTAAVGGGGGGGPAATGPTGGAARINKS